MTLDQNDLGIIVNTMKSVVNQVLAARLEEVYAVLEEIRGQFQHSITTLDATDHALLAEIRRVQGASPAELVDAVNEGWERFVMAEHKRLTTVQKVVAK